MRKGRLILTLLSSVFAISTLAGCTPSALNLPPVETIQKDGLNIKSITFENVPDEIMVGYFDTYGIYLKIVYSDDSFEEYPLKMKKLPDQVKEKLNTVGKHTVTIAFRGEEITYIFNVVPGIEKFVVRYLTYDGVVIAQEDVKPSSPHITIQIPSGPARNPDSLYFYEFSRWSEILTHETLIYHDMDIYPLYNRTQKRYFPKYPDSNTDTPSNMRILYAHADNAHYGIYSAYIHLGRLDRVPMLYTEPQPASTHTYNASLYYDYTDGESVQNCAYNLGKEIFNKAFNVNYDRASDYYSYMVGAGTLTEPLIYSNKTDDLDNKMEGHTYTSFNSGLEISKLNASHLLQFVENHGPQSSDDFVINVPDDVSSGYTRGAIEANVDVVLHLQFMRGTSVSSQYYHYDLYSIKYYFMVDQVNTYHTVEYDSNQTFGAPSGQDLISFNMQQLNKILQEVPDFIDE